MAPLDRLSRPLIGPVEKIAPRLLGAVVRSGAVAIRLTEVEAYAGVGQDEASHSHRGRTKRNAIMFGPAGHLYVYFTYGMHWCANIVTGVEGSASAVLLRAGEVVDGLELAIERRGSRVPNKDLARGPARLAAALGLDGSANGLNVLDPSSPVRLTLPRKPVQEFESGPRVGVAKETERPWRFWLPGEPTVSPYRRR
ncbi:MAG TPA: DNA-3-methyladenine glycosylase [Candidatus Limnocylindrales bacterium]|nr:DNA-3-methyladenine glycosylase [Candidatus Limnocylindrales bacterium]